MAQMDQEKQGRRPGKAVQRDENNETEGFIKSMAKNSTKVAVETLSHDETAHKNIPTMG